MNSISQQNNTTSILQRGTKRKTKRQQFFSVLNQQKHYNSSTSVLEVQFSPRIKEKGKERSKIWSEDGYLRKKNGLLWNLQNLCIFVHYSYVTRKYIYRVWISIQYSQPYPCYQKSGTVGGGRYIKYNGGHSWPRSDTSSKDVPVMICRQAIPYSFKPFQNLQESRPIVHICCPAPIRQPIRSSIPL